MLTPDLADPHFNRRLQSLRHNPIAAYAIAIGAVAIATLGSRAQPGLLPGAQTGRASWYEFTSQTANGEQMNPNELTAAHRSLPFGTKIRVENLDDGRSVDVRINDRGPFTGNRIIDLSKAAASCLGMIENGIATVRIRSVPSRNNQNRGRLGPKAPG